MDLFPLRRIFVMDAIWWDPFPPAWDRVKLSENLDWTRLYWLWQYRLWSFQTGGTKLGRFLPKNQHTQRKLLNFENWVSGEVSKIGHHL